MMEPLVYVVHAVNCARGVNAGLYRVTSETYDGGRSRGDFEVRGERGECGIDG